MAKINLKKLIFGIIIVLAAVIVLLAIGMKGASQDKPAVTPSASNPAINQKSEEQKNNPVEYVFDKGTGEKISYKIIPEAGSLSVFDALKKLADENKFELKYNNNYSFGVFIESIMGIENGKKIGEKYWQYWINGKLGEVAADKKEIKAGDEVEWKYANDPGY